MIEKWQYVDVGKTKGKDEGEGNENMKKRN